MDDAYSIFERRSVIQVVFLAKKLENANDVQVTKLMVSGGQDEINNGNLVNVKAERQS